MRSSKSRSRSKTNRPRTLGNIINRVFDSSGPEGKVRGTPQQIVEKYQTLARDAQLSNDRVAAENFLQHAEHYTRLLAEAMREMAAEQEARMGQQGGQNSWQNRQNEQRDGQPRESGEGDQPYAVQDVTDGDVGLVDLPEAERPAPRQFQPRQNDRRQNDNRQNDNRQNNRPRDERPRDDRARDERARDDRPREERKPRLRFEDGSDAEVIKADAAKPAPIFESPAALVAQVAENATEKSAAKQRAPRVKRAEVTPNGDDL
ncbi:MAG: DUF4167 domain-containing protein [Cypionkella sp.]|nr:DUF4167 domain-containing protein [Cypionkella sp.]